MVESDLSVRVHGKKIVVFSEEEKINAEILMAITPTYRRVENKHDKINLDQIYSEAKRIYKEEGKKRLVSYIKGLPDIPTIIPLWFYLLGQGLKIRMDHMPKDYISNVVDEISKKHERK